MIYLDSSVAFARILAEERRPPESFWDAELLSSRLLVYELRTRLNARGLDDTYSRAASALVARVLLIDMSELALARAIDRFPVELRTLDALHLATLIWAAEQGKEIALATYDRRMSACAAALGVSVLPL